MKAQEIEQFRLKKESFWADLIVPVGREEKRQHAGEYVSGLLMDRERKSIKPMAKSLMGEDVQVRTNL
jgi:hypothetical protein